MKPKLNKKDQAVQGKICKKLFTGQSLASLFGGAENKSGSDKNKERATASNSVSEKTIEQIHLAGEALPPWHIVQNGDTIESIAASYGVTVNRLKKLNKLSDEQAAALKVGQNIRIL